MLLPDTDTVGEVTMYLAFYGLEKDPFSLDPDLNFLFTSKAHEEAIAHLAYGLEQDEDITLITGDIGTGKTMALHRLLKHASGSFLPVLINVTTLDFEQFLRLVLHKLPDQDQLPNGVADLLHRLETVLVDLRKRGRKVLLVVDEAQNFPVEVLEGIRMLLNLARPGEQVLQLVLVGQLGLEDKLNLPVLRQFKQRIRVAYRFERLNREELAAYVGHRLEVAGGTGRIFRNDALDRLYELSDGVPRLVNHFAGKAMLAGFVAGDSSISAKHIEEDETADTAVEPGRIPEVEPEKPHAPAPSVKDEPRERQPRPAAPAPEYVHHPFARRDHGGRTRAVIAVIVLLVVIALFTFGYWGPHLGLARNSPKHTVSPDFLADSQAVESPLDTMTSLASPASSMAEPGVSPQDSAVADAGTEIADVDSAHSTAAEASADSILVHVSSFATEDRAESVRMRLRSEGIQAFVRRTTLDGNRVWFRVYMGPFAGEPEARAVIAELQETRLINYYSIIRSGLPD